MPCIKMSSDLWQVYNGTKTVDQKTQIRYTVIVVVRKEPKMAEVKLSGLYKVTITEYERGWGQRIDSGDIRFYTTLEEAEAYKAHWETGGSPDIFWRAEIQKVS